MCLIVGLDKEFRPSGRIHVAALWIESLRLLKRFLFFQGRSIEVEYFGDEILGLEVLELIGNLPNEIFVPDQRA